jgi:CelD/BcsL family acetyltransferase involved in cellulose biosynthesis
VRTTARCLDRPPPGWRELIAADPGATAAHRPALWAALAAVRPGTSVRCLAVEADGALRGGLPVLVERRGGLHWLRALPFMLPGAPVAAAGAHAEVDAAVAVALRALQRELGAVGGEWVLYRPGGPPVAPDAREVPAGETRWVRAATIELADGPEAAWARVDRETRRDIRHARARLAWAEEPAALEEAYALHMGQARAWRGHPLPPVELSRRLLADGGDGLGPLARLFTLRRGRALVCATLALDHPRETMPWWSGSDPAARRLGAFPFLLWGVVEWAARAGRDRVNLGGSAGAEPVAAFKDSLGAGEVRYPVRWLGAPDAGVVGRVVARLQRRLQAGRPRGEES